MCEIRKICQNKVSVISRNVHEIFTQTISTDLGFLRQTREGISLISN